MPRTAPASSSGLHFRLMILLILSLCVGRCGGGSNPTSPSQATSTPAAASVQVSTRSTNAQGEVTFEELGSAEPVVVQVRDAGGSPVASTEVTYWDGSGFEVFVSSDPRGRYFDALKIAPHNSLQPITMHVDSIPMAEDDTSGELGAAVQRFMDWAQPRGECISLGKLTPKDVFNSIGSGVVSSGVGLVVKHPLSILLGIAASLGNATAILWSESSSTVPPELRRLELYEYFEAFDCWPNLYTFKIRQYRAGPLKGGSSTPPSVTTNAASAVTSNSASLNATVNPNGSPSVGWFEWGTTNPPTSQTSAQDLGNGTNSVPFSHVLSGLTSGTTYHFRALSRGGGSSVSTAAILTFTTTTADSGSVPCQTPESVKLVSMTPLSGSTVRAGWPELRAPIVATVQYALQSRDEAFIAVNPEASNIDVANRFRRDSGIVRITRGCGTVDVGGAVSLNETTVYPVTTDEIVIRMTRDSTIRDVIIRQVVPGIVYTWVR